MPKFHYKAMDSKGREVEGVLDVENESRAIATIKEKGLFPTQVADISGKRAPGGRPGPAGKNAKARENEAPGGRASLWARDISAGQIGMIRHARLHERGARPRCD